MKKIYFPILVCLVLILSNCSSTNTSQTNDGLSMETAIKVKSVAKEYTLLTSLCPDCKLKSQGVTSKGSRSYDVMTMIKPNGETVVYYFDITSFYGNF
jgi:uncharacterized protein YcfL